MREFDNADQMDDYLITKNNEVVKPEDLVYWLGDVTMDEKYLHLVSKFNGKKRLVQGNHDKFKMARYLQYFQKVFSSRLLDKMLMTHIPIHPLSMGKALCNLHGHVHLNVPADHFGNRYYNVSCEALDYVPISFEDLKKKALKRLEEQ